MDMMCNIDKEWSTFCEGQEVNHTYSDFTESNNFGYTPIPELLPECGTLYISTKTKISYLSQNINLSNVFWKVQVLPYHIQKEGVVKKQMKFNSTTSEELEVIKKNIDTTCGDEKNHIDQHIMTHIENPDGRIKFKDVRKISIGLCKKDILSNRCKKKSAFYNCFVVILRINVNNMFKEINVKVFNTGKLEIPGIQTDDVLVKVLELLISILRPLVDAEEQLTYIRGKCETVLINSNFNCGYFINRDKIYDLLKYKYKINCSFDPCSYPGIQCEFHYDPKLVTQTGRQPQDIAKRKDLSKVSFMIFRTGSVLIVGKCTEQILHEIYTFVRKILEVEYKDVGEELVDSTQQAKDKEKKLRKRKVIKINISPLLLETEHEEEEDPTTTSILTSIAKIEQVIVTKEEQDALVQQS